MRLFTGLDLPDDIRDRLERLLIRLRPTAQLKWSPIENLHITTKFIGEWPESKLEDLSLALASIAGRPSIPVRMEGLGWFPNRHQPRVLFVGVHGGPQLSELAATIDQVVGPLGIARETKPYSPHITLARVSQQASLADLERAIAGLESAEFGTFQADRFYLYMSKAGPKGSVYTKMSEFPFSG